MHKLDIPKRSERIQGITLPSGDPMYVIDYDEVFKINLITCEVAELEDDPYTFLDSRDDLLSNRKSSPILNFGANSISYNRKSAPAFGSLRYRIERVLRVNRDFATVRYIIADKQGKLSFRTLSGDWFAASFSPCGKYLELAEPYQFDVYRL